MQKIQMQQIINYFKLNPKEMSFKFMTTNFLKIIAAFAMFTDHFGAIGWANQVPDETYFLLRQIGRLAFVLYAFFVCVAIYYSSNKKKYLVSRLIFGLIYQAIVIILYFSFGYSDPFYLNIFFVLFFGAYTIYAFNRNFFYGLAVFLGIMLFYFLYVNLELVFNFSSNYVFTIDYNFYGYFLILFIGLAFYFHKKMPTIFFKLLLIGLFIMLNLIFHYVIITNPYFSRLWNIGDLQLYSLWAIPLFLFYNQQDHYKNEYIKWIFTTAYPLSFIVPTIIFSIIS